MLIYEFWSWNVPVEQRYEYYVRQAQEIEKYSEDQQKWIRVNLRRYAQEMEQGESETKFLGL